MRKFINNVPVLKCNRTNGKFALLLFINIFLFQFSYSQETITNSKGEKIILNQNGTWQNVNSTSISSSNGFTIEKGGPLSGSENSIYPMVYKILKVIEINGENFPFILLDNNIIYRNTGNRIEKPNKMGATWKELSDINYSDREWFAVSYILPSMDSQFSWSFKVQHENYYIYYSVDKNNDIFTMSYIGNGQFQLKKVGKVIDWSK